MTTSDEFLLELGDVLGGQASMRPVESLDGALEHLGSSRRAQLIAFDIRGVPDVRQQIERARTRAPNITVLAFADSNAEPAAASSLEGANVFALLPCPVDRRKTSLALESAIAAAEKAPIARVGEAPQAPAHHASAAALQGALRKPLFLVAGASVLALVLGTTAWLLMRGEEAPIAGSEAPVPAVIVDSGETELQATPPEVALVQGTLDELLEKARLAMRQRRFNEPAGDNALVYFRSAVALDASNAEAVDGLARVGGVLIARVEEALDANLISEAVTALAIAKGAIPGDARIAALEARVVTTQVAAAITEGNFDRAASLARATQQNGTVPADQIARWQTEIAQRQNDMRFRRAMELANERLRDGRLVEPANDSARHYVQQLSDLAPASAATQRLRKELASAYLRKARESSLAGRAGETERWLGEARSAGVTQAEIIALQRELAVTRQRAAAAEGDRLAQLARERVREGRLTEPANDSAAHYLSALRSADESHAAMAPLSRELAAKLLDRAGEAARAGRSAQLDTDLTAARRWGAEAKDIQAVRQSAASSRTRQESSATKPVPVQKQLKRTRYVAPDYPERALQKGASGSVTVDFVVDVNGEPRDLKVTASEPAGLFDKAALNAVRRWRYDPVIVDEVPVEIPTRTIIRFEAPKE